ncbi:methyltransferase domain-containing protein [Sorangium sp. So ce131]|uniref:methyltransferase domain-containing protein n=1 Tax=Sorangium sp. So ce131 TaxID=3133282 RepID=UPI003F639F31
MDLRRVQYWEDLSLHRWFLSDRVRNEAYREAIHRHVAAGTRVLDLGTGTGLLAMFAAQAGAAHVTAVDWSGLVPYAEEAARRSGLGARMTFVRADLREWEDAARYDLITHDLIGGFLWEENAAAILARIGARQLAPGGRILPSRVDLFLAPVALPDPVEAGFWAEPRYGLDLSSFMEVERSLVRSRLRSTVVHWRGDDGALAEPGWTAALDAYAPAPRPGELAADFVISRAGALEGVLGWFIIHFDEHTRVCTAPTAPATHWGQIFVPVASPLDVRPGDRVHVAVETSALCSEWRASATAARRSTSAQFAPVRC